MENYKMGNKLNYFSLWKISWALKFVFDQFMEYFWAVIWGWRRAMENQVKAAIESY